MRKINYLLSSMGASVALLMTTPSNAQGPRGTPAQEKGCAHLRDKEQRFAALLCAPHKDAFCSAFTSTQRQQAMRLAAKNNMDPNDAVHAIMVENDMPMKGPCVPPLPSRY